ncbi:MAG TPA: bifunctional diaminohydroxyphosphoribosylaminopyrimidine deaminase/5-amino-6-(5-phosphoribosylamino)uracil reductase RibD [Chitinophagaceae bacterium]|nr:bifunctional diaminohydroxyphosphoribosylaminopyrimidine deaminase/5-amino-6-(5-phosphoribosylamino)uracil reductase RibD [Chitinophagaceae bacterium]
MVNGECHLFGEISSLKEWFIFARYHSRLTIDHSPYMQRCLELAEQGAGYVAPNPMVGAVLLHEDKIIGEGWHQQYGGPHAEVNCIAQAIQNGQADKLDRSTLYVSLEPCVHHGKTPPCTDLIIQHKIKKVVIGCRDPFKEVDGKGIEKLRAAGVEVELVDRLLAYECKNMNKRFLTFHTKQRPYIILKWAQTADHKISSGNNERLMISNEYSNRLVHKWRSEEASILVGTNTAMLDDPELTTRLWPGPSPIRLVIDMNLRLPSSLKIFDQQVRTIVFNKLKHEENGNLLYYQVTNDANLVPEVIKALYQLNIQSVLVEGGAKLLRSFMDDGLWDETRIIHNYSLHAGDGLNAPQPENAILVGSEELFSDTIETYVPATEDY